jgi:catalase
MPDLPQPTDGRSIVTASSQEAQPSSHTDTGAPAPSDRNSLTLGADGPILLHDTHFLNQMAHFNQTRCRSARCTQGLGGVRRVRDH